MSDPLESYAGDGAPLSAAVVDQASEWLVKIWSGVATAKDYEACARWRAAHVDHERAWQRLQALEQKLDIVPRGIARETLKRGSVSVGRRRTLKSLAGLLTAGAATYAVSRTTAWQRYASDHRTDTGEIRHIVLADSTQVSLNTSTAIDVIFDANQRRIELKSGEIMVSTAPDTAEMPRPFLVTTAHGSVRALGTKFTVRHTDDGTSHVAVFEGAVMIQPELGTAQPMRLDAGRQSFFSSKTVAEATAADTSTSAWTQGSLIVERMRLDAFIQELARYRPGLLRCDPSAGHYLLTGVYPLADTDRILAAVAKTLPIDVHYRSRYWVTVAAREPSK